MKTFQSSDPFVNLLYFIMRDEIPCGKIEEIVLMIENNLRVDTQYSNGYLAEYAENLVKRLKNI